MATRSAQDESELGGRTLDDEDDGDGPTDDFVGLPPLPDGSFETDDAPASDLETGVELEEPGTEGGDEPDPELIPVEQLIETIEKSDDDTSDEAGPAGFDASTGLAEIPELEPEEDDECEGDLPAVELFSDELRPPDDDTDDGEGGELEWVEPMGWTDDEELPWSQRRWPCDELGGEAAWLVVAGAGETVLVAGRRLRRWSLRGEETGDSLPLDSRPRSAAGTEPLVLVSTATGQLLSVDTRRRHVTPISSWRGPAGARRGDHVTLDLVGAGGSSFVARTSTGSLLASTDGGARWRRIDAPGSVLALARVFAGPLVALAAGRGRASLLCSTDGERWIPQTLDAVGRRYVDSGVDLLAAAGNLVVAGSRTLGLAVSTDGGASFEPAGGCSNPTAVALGTLDGTVTAWAALYHEADDRSEVVAIDPCSRKAVRLAALGGEPGDDTERGRVECLFLDPRERCLWAVGGFGTTRLRAPRDGST